MKTMCYTFRTFPELNILEKYFGQVFVFGKLKENLEKFKEIILEQDPDLILGIANNKKSSIKPIAINNFGKNKKVSKEGKNFYDLFIPEELSKVIPISRFKDDTFCNWTAYKIAEYIEENNLETRLSFVHLNMKDELVLNKLDRAINAR